MYDVGTGDHEVSCVHFAPGGDPSIVLGEQSVETNAGRADGGRTDGGRPQGDDSGVDRSDVPGGDER
jgi:peptide/nickel transport system ATP-binding protein